MLDDLTEKIQSSQNKLEQLIGQIPGFAGYRAKEQRREADKILRLHVASQYEDVLDRLNRVQYDLVSAGDLTGMMLLERAVSRTQLLIDRIRNASYGYTGLFDAIKMDEAALDRLYDFDQGMLDGAAALGEKLDAVVAASQAGQAVQEAGNALMEQLESLHRLFSERQQVMLS
ncbi:MAG: hypothetical protein ACOX2L_09565 [Anaerolineae bacterium]|jgi:hypothetical protein|nr:hypothetical protein [Chloroflexota bacterium]